MLNSPRAAHAVEYTIKTEFRELLDIISRQASQDLSGVNIRQSWHHGECILLIQQEQDRRLDDTCEMSACQLRSACQLMNSIDAIVM